MTIKELGYNDGLEDYRKENGLDAFNVGRVISEHRERYIVRTDAAEFDSELMGNLRFSAESRDDLPAVGDWVALSEYDDGKALIHAVYPRHSVIERQAVGKFGQKQIIATNIDHGWIVQAVDRDFNVNRLERYLTICYSSRVSPIIVLSKIDLISAPELEKILHEIGERIKNVPIFPVSSETPDGYAKLASIIESGKTYCLLGSSGVGKSTLLNHIAGQELMETSEISTSVKKGRHTTTHRELIILENGGILIDNPGMREVGIADTSGGLEMTFDSIVQLSEDCKYKDCTHIHEDGCAILEAIEKGELDEDAYENYQKMEREKNYFESSVHERRKKDKKFGKMMKDVVKNRKKNKY